MKMERLTSRNPLTESQAMNLSLTDLYMRLKTYEDAEEQGRLVVFPPVKIGDTLFYILNGKIYEGKLYRIAYENHQGKIHTDISADRGYNAYRAHFEDFGKIVFAAREEAEKALEGMNNG